MWILFLIIGLIVLLLLIIPIIYTHYILNYWKFQGVPHEKSRKLIDIIRLLLSNEPFIYESSEERFQALYTQFKDTGPFCGYYHLLRPRVLVLDRELVKQILITNFSNFNDRGTYYNRKKDPLSADLFNIDGDKWKEMRVKLDPIFRKDQLRYIFNGIDNESLKLLRVIDNIVQQKQQNCVNVLPILRRYVLATIATSVFGLNDSKRQKYTFKEFEMMTEKALTTSKHGAFMNGFLNRYPNFGRRFQFITTNPDVHNYFLELIKDVITEREESKGETAQDYLQLFIDLKIHEFHTHESLSDNDVKQLKDHIFNELAAQAFGFLTIGFEAVAYMIAAALYELAQNPTIQEQTRSELIEIFKKHNNEFSYEFIKELRFMGQVISETVRLHPFKPFIIRRTLHDYHVPNHPNYKIQKELFVMIPLHAMQTDPANFSNPLMFDPLRFSSSENNERESCVWLGFGEGPRSCIGIHFLQLQMRLALARLLLDYKFKSNSNYLPITNSSFDTNLEIELINHEVSGRESQILI